MDDFYLKGGFSEYKKIPLGMILVIGCVFNSEIWMLHNKQVSVSRQNVSNLGQMALETLQRRYKAGFRPFY